MPEAIRDNPKPGRGRLDGDVTVVCKDDEAVDGCRWLRVSGNEGGGESSD